MRSFDFVVARRRHEQRQQRRPSLKATIGLAPFMPSGNLATDRVPTMAIAVQSDTTISPVVATTL
jgi:hypothetical protein